MKKGRKLRPGVWVALGAALSSQTALAQGGPNYYLTSTVDAYGNARPVYLDRRPVALFQNETQREILRSYQSRGRRVDRRGGYSPFAFSGDYLAVGRTRRALSPLGSIYGPRRRGARINRFAFLGEPVDRRASIEPGTAAAAVVRRSRLIGATALNAPVRNAMLKPYAPIVSFETSRDASPPAEVLFAGARKGGFRLGRGAPVGLPKRAEPDGGQISAGGAGIILPTLDQRLRLNVRGAARYMRSEGWKWFREGRYGRAARAFETAALLQPTDSQSRIGEIFSHVSVGAIRTAVAVLAELGRRDKNPFTHQLNMVEAYGAVTQARRVSIELKLLNAGGTDRTDVAALQMLTLWYLGERGEALRVAAGVTEDVPPGSVYASWPAKMREAASVAHKETGQP